ncbi:hypothetical protein JZ785_27175 [Alicyclobacillus curvatus]|nr:hypothetical protein JZ785_27175 [Alicyclobacillus curvatus]
MKSRTESIVDPEAGYMEFRLDTQLGYQEWRGMFAELGVKSTLFNGYMVQSEENAIQISTTPVQMHLYEEAIYLAPPFEARSYYFEIPRQHVKLGKVYFQIPPDRTSTSLDGFKPQRTDLYALDIFVLAESGEQTIYSLLFEARIKTDQREYYISRFESEQIIR